jgi:hydroxyacylglutathione hydrolase
LYRHYNDTLDATPDATLMDTLTIIPLPAFEDNYIWALRNADGHVAVVDPGDEAPVQAWLERSGDRLCAILVTHHHGDHTGGIEALIASHDVPVYAPAVENIPCTTHPLHGGENIRLAALDVEFDVLAVPGHTRGHISYYRRGLLFCGDTLFGAGCGKIFEGTPEQMYASLARLAELPGDTQVYCAHEYTESCLRFAALVEPDNPAVRDRSTEAARLRAAGQPTVPSTLALELATNPFLRWRSPAVIAAAARHLGRSPGGDAETFAAIRDWKNHN